MLAACVSLLLGSSALVALHAPRVALPPRAGLLRSVAVAPELASKAVPEPTGYDAWVKDFDFDGFGKEVAQLGKTLADGQGAEDIAHLKKMILWSNLCGAVGVATMWMSSPIGRLISILGFSTWTCTRWTMIGHHICHGGYNRQDDEKLGGTGRFTTANFGVGSVWRRCRDWLDWMLPEAWNVEHNNLHHYRLSERGDPDLVERNLELLRTQLPLPKLFKYIAVAGIAAMWKWYYYAPNTYKQLKVQQLRKQGVKLDEESAEAPLTLPLVFFDWKTCKEFGTGPIDFMRRVMGPYLAVRFFAMPLPLLFFGRTFYWAAVANIALADVVSNLHSFIIIATNHCGDDMYKFENSCTPRSGTFYMRAVGSSANFRTSNGVGKPVHGFTADVNDFFHGWLNYQVEHHAWPQLSMLSYQKAAPQMRAICEKYGMPYVQQNVFRRLKKTVDIMVGSTSMRDFPAEWEHEKDRFVWADQK